MRLHRRTVLGLAAALSAGPPAAARSRPPDPAERLKLWPAGAPGGQSVTVTPEVVERSADPAFHDRYVVHVTDPELTVYRPARPDGSALLLIPGGGYRWAVIDKEGADVARVFAGLGVTCFVLAYRQPADGWAAGPDTPLQDTQRALRLIRAGAAGYGVDPARIGVLGASAGGHMAGSLLSRFDAEVYPPADAADRQSARPDFGVLLYPVATMHDPYVHAGSRQHLIGADAPPARRDAYSLERTVTGREPPTFLLHAADDAAVPVENSLQLFAALRAAGVPAELHVFEEGGHGFGVRLIEGRPAAVWPELVRAWGRRRGWFR